jgi:hypothetical protein
MKNCKDHCRSRWFGKLPLLILVDLAAFVFNQFL